MEFKEIAHIRLYESVMEQIMNLLKNKELKPGDQLPPERELAEKFSISRGSLREAFRVLESRGLIERTSSGPTRSSNARDSFGMISATTRFLSSSGKVTAFTGSSIENSN